MGTIMLARCLHSLIGIRHYCSDFKEMAENNVGSCSDSSGTISPCHKDAVSY